MHPSAYLCVVEINMQVPFSWGEELRGRFLLIACLCGLTIDHASRGKCTFRNELVGKLHLVLPTKIFFFSMKFTRPTAEDS